MSMVLTLIVGKNKDLTDAVHAATTALQTAGLIVDGTKTLSPDEAADLYFSGDAATAQTAIKNSIVAETADWAVQETAYRRKKLLLADMDSTMITVECIDELADFAGIKDQVVEVTEAAMRGELDFEQALLSRVALLRGLEEGALARCYRERVHLMPGARELIKTCEANGCYTALVSGGFTFFTERVQQELGFSQHTSNVLEIEDGKLTGRVIPPICDAHTKLTTLRLLRSMKRLTDADVIAVGDGANDIPMLVEAGLGVAYHAKPKAAGAADVALHHSDLTALLYLQGYSLEDFVS